MRGDSRDPEYPPSWYAATAAAGPPALPLEGDARADICIIGGGYTGLGAALRLAQAGADVRLIDQARIGWGASGRNGGQAHVGQRRDPAWLEKAVGPDDAMHLWRIAIDARDHLDQLIADHAIACDFTPGLLHVDHKRRYVAQSRAAVEHLRTRYHYPHAEFIDGEALSEMLGAKGYQGGILDRRGGHLHPLNLALGMALAAANAGARLHEQTRATAINRTGTGWRVITPQGSITANRVVLAGNGYLRGLSLPVEARVMPINNYIAVTEPLGEARARSLIRDNVAVADSRFVVYYFRLTPDHRLLFGGGENYRWRFPPDIPAFVRPHMLRVFPQLADVKIDHGWGGTLGVTPTRMPFVREVEPGLTAIGGYSGLGVVLAPYFGKLIGDALTGGNSPDFDRLTRIPVPTFPGGRLLRWPTLVAAMSMFALRDRL